MPCPTHAYADVVVVSASGRIDFAGAQALEAAIAPTLAPDSSVRGLVVDLAGVDYISSVGLRALMMAAKTLRAQERTLGVAAPQPLVREIFEISRFNMILDVSPTLRAGLERLSAQAVAAFDAATAGGG